MEQTRVEGNIRITSDVHVGSTEFVLCGSSEDDKGAVSYIRDTLYFGSGGLIFLRFEEVEGKTSMVVTAKRCKHCDACMNDWNSCHWETCNACAEKCEHEYERGMTLGGSSGVGMGEHCTKCGRCKPRKEGEREPSQLEQHLAIERETGIQVMYPEGPVSTPSEALELKRLMRKLDKVKKRQEGEDHAT